MVLRLGRIVSRLAGAGGILSRIPGLGSLRDRSIGFKIGAGFAVILIFFLVAGVVTYQTLRSASAGFMEYRGIARSSNALAKVQADLLGIRDTVKDYLITGSDEALKNYESHITATRARLASTKAEMDDPERIAKLAGVESKLARYDEAFGQITALRKKRDHLVNDVIFVHGPQMGDKINDLFQRFQGAKDPEVLYQLGNALKYLNSGRLYATRFLDTGDPAMADSADSELFLFEDYLFALDQILDEYSLTVLTDIKKSLALYKDALTQAVDAVKRQKVLADEIIGSIGPEVAADIGELTDSIRTRQDSLGPKLVARNASANALVAGLLCAAMVLGLLIALYLARAITLPLRRATTVMEAIRLGRLDERVGFSQRDEVGRLSRAIDDFADSLSGFSGLLRRMAGGDFSMQVPLQSKDDVMGKAARQMVDGVRSLARGARRASEEVSTGAGEMLDASQSLSQAATEQAASVEEITSTMQMIGAQARENADNAAKARDLGQEAEKAARTGVSEMDGLVHAMHDLNESSRSIAKIIKVIDEIAFQTNLLALNAAVEAARAGKHGRGFSVVANEVRNLASRSAKAAEETEGLIEATLGKVALGTRQANRTAEVLDEIVEIGHRSSVLVDEIATASEEQARGAAEVGIALDQVQGVTQDNTAQAEEVAAAATELASQSRALRGLIGRFRIGGGAQEVRALDPAPERALPESIEEPEAAASPAFASTAEQPRDAWPLDGGEDARETKQDDAEPDETASEAPAAELPEPREAAPESDAAADNGPIDPEAVRSEARDEDGDHAGEDGSRQDNEELIRPDRIIALDDDEFGRY